MSYIIPVKNPRYGWKFRKPWFHKGVDLLPTKSRTKQDILAAENGRYLYKVLGTCGGFDWKDKNGMRHRYCHVDMAKRFFKKGDVIGIMNTKGYQIPKGTTHLHWVVWDKFGKLIDPLSLDFEEARPLHTLVNRAFRQIFIRNPNTKENNYYLRRIYKDIKTYEKLVDVLKYWRAQGRTTGR